MGDEHKRPGLIRELNRRNVFRAAAAYVLIGWVLLQVADVLFPALSLPDWTTRFVAGLLILGFPLVIFFAWAYELTPEGLKRETDATIPASVKSQTARRLNVAVVLLLLAALGILVLRSHVWNAPEPVGSNLAQDPQPGIPAPPEKSIAVLPFANTSEDPANEHFSDGMAEELLSLLARIPDLRVIGRSSSFQFKGRNEDLRSIGEQLGVSNLLEGSVRKSGNMVRVTAQLVSTKDGASLWSESFNRSLDDIFAVQEEIARAVVEALKVELLDGVVADRQAPASNEAYDLYLRGRYLSRQLGESRLEQARQYFHRALELDPEMAPAWLGLGGVIINEVLSGEREREEGLRSARNALERALELDSTLAQAHYNLAFIRMTFDWDFVSAESEFRRSLALEPNSAATLSGLGLLMIALRRPQEAIDLQRRSLAIDPLRPASHHNLGYVAYFAHEFELSEESFRATLELTDDYPRGHYYLGTALLMQGRADEACREIAMDSSRMYRLAGIALCTHASGMMEEADAALSELMENFPDEAAFYIAEALARRSRTDDVFQWLERSANQREPAVLLVHSSPLLTEIKTDPRYDELLDRLGF